MNICIYYYVLLCIIILAFLPGLARVSQRLVLYKKSINLFLLFHPSLFHQRLCVPQFNPKKLFFQSGHKSRSLPSCTFQIFSKKSFSNPHYTSKLPYYGARRGLGPYSPSFKILSTIWSMTSGEKSHLATIVAGSIS